MYFTLYTMCITLLFWNTQCASHYFFEIQLEPFAKKTKQSEKNSALYPTSKIELFAKIVNSFQSLTSFSKNSILYIWQGSEYASDNNDQKVTEIIYSGSYQDTCTGCLFNDIFWFPAEVAIHRHYRLEAVLKLGQLQVLSVKFAKFFKTTFLWNTSG